MDEIKIQYGISLSKEDQDLINYAFTDEEKEKAAKLKSQIKTCTLFEFLHKVDPKELSETERNIQRAMRKIYNLNGKEPPLYHKFSTFRSDEHPLTIDITTAGNNEGDYAAAYGVHDNRITFEDVDNPNFLVLTLAHELKHAEQADERGYQWYRRSIDGFSMENAYAWHQQEFLQEAQAYALDGRVYCEVFGQANDIDHGESKLYEEISKKYTTPDGQKDHKKIEEEMIRIQLDRLYNDKHYKHYKDAYDMHAPIGENDKGIDQIPEVFHLSQDLMEKLKEAPRVARSLDGKLLQAEKNKHLDQYIELLHESVAQNEEISPSLGYIFRNGSLEQVQDVLAIKKQNNEYLFSDDDIQDAFSDCKNPDVFKHLLMANRGDQPIINKETIVKGLTRLSRNFEDFNTFLTNVQDRNGSLPLTEKDFLNKYGDNELLSHLSTYDEEERSNLIKVLPQIIKLKGNDGKPLVSEKHLVEELGNWIKGMETPENLQALLKGITDEKGNLPFSREAFDIRNSEYEHVNGQNQLLYHLRSYTDEDKKYATAIIPTLMALKDKEGKPIISQENIDKFPEYDDLAQVVKTYKRSSGIKQAMQTKAKAGAKKLEQNPEGYVKKGKTTSKKSRKIISNLKKDSPTL